jgi:hypothetical protein
MALWRDTTRLWMQRLDEGSVPVEFVRPASCRCTLSVYAGWSPSEQPGVFRGPRMADWLVVESAAGMRREDPQRWDHAFPFSPCGFPSPQVAAALHPRPRLVISTAEPVSEACRMRLGVDEACAYSGLADYRADGGRVYILLLRRDTSAWKLFLSLSTTAGAGEEVACLRHDHRRAAVVFGSLALDA